MRGVIVAGMFVFCALFAGGQEVHDAVALLDGGFAPGGANFQVTFAFSDMQAAPGSAKKPRELTAPGLALSAGEWSGAQGATARLEMCCLKQAMGLDDGTLAVARLRLANPMDHPFKTTLAVAIAPQGMIHALAFERHAFLMEGRLVLVADTPSCGGILADSPFASRPLTPQDQAHVESVKGECRGEMLYDLVMAPGQTQTLAFICPIRVPGGREPDLDFYRGLSIDDLFAQARKQATPQR